MHHIEYVQFALDNKVHKRYNNYIISKIIVGIINLYIVGVNIMTFYEALNCFNSDPLGEKLAAQNYTAGEKARKKFVKEFSPDRIKEMNIDDYLIDNPKSFCNRLDNELSLIGETRGKSLKSKFGIYTKNNEIVFTKKWGKDKYEAFENIKDAIINLLIAGDAKDFRAIEHNKLAPTVKGKILSVYHPDKYLTVYSYEHVRFFADLLGIPYDKDTAPHEIKKKILKYKNKDSSTKDMKIPVYTSFLYFWNHPKKRKEVEKNYEQK